MADRTDNFTRANNAAGLGANWTNFLDAMEIRNNMAVGHSSGVYGGAYWSADSWANDQTSEVVLAPAVLIAGPVVRATVGGNGYFGFAYSGAIRIYRVDSGTFNLLHDFGGSAAGGDVIKLTVTGNTLEIFQNTVSLGTTIDPGVTYTSGSVGVFSLGDGTVPGLSSWNGTGVTGGGGGAQDTPELYGTPFGRSGQRQMIQLLSQ